MINGIKASIEAMKANKSANKIVAEKTVTCNGEKVKVETEKKPITNIGDLKKQDYEDLTVLQEAMEEVNQEEVTTTIEVTVTLTTSQQVRLDAD